MKKAPSGVGRPGKKADLTHPFGPPCNPGYTWVENSGVCVKDAYAPWAFFAGLVFVMLVWVVWQASKPS